MQVGISFPSCGILPLMTTLTHPDAAGFVRASTTAAPVLERTRHALRSYLAMLFGVPCWQLIGVPTSHRGHWFVLTADAADRGPKSRRSLRCRGYASPVLRSVDRHRAATVVDSLARHFCDASWLARVARADAEPIRETRTRRMSSITCAGALYRAEAEANWSFVCRREGCRTSAIRSPPKSIGWAGRRSCCSRKSASSESWSNCTPRESSTASRERDQLTGVKLQKRPVAQEPNRRYRPILVQRQIVLVYSANRAPLLPSAGSAARGYLGQSKDNPRRFLIFAESCKHANRYSRVRERSRHGPAFHTWRSKERRVGVPEMRRLRQLEE